MNLSGDTGSVQLKVALILLAGAVGATLAAQGFEHIGGFTPCKLCYAQREPYYAGIPVALIATLSAWRHWPSCITRGMLIIGGLLMVYTASIGVYQAGAEWGWWPGPADCSAASGGEVTNAGDLLSQLTEPPAPACDVAQMRILGLSFAGLNAIAGFGLAAIAFYGAFAGGRKNRT